MLMQAMDREKSNTFVQPSGQKESPRLLLRLKPVSAAVTTYIFAAKSQ